MHLPTNIASLPSHTVRCLRALGVDATAYAYGRSPVVTSQRDVVEVRYPSKKRLDLWIRLLIDYVRNLRQADIIHWYYETRFLPFGLDLAPVRLLGKPAVVEWQGSEVRDPEVERLDNPVYEYAREHGYEFRDIETHEHSVRVQATFANAGFDPVVAPGMAQYVHAEYRAHMHIVDRGVILSDFEPSYPSPLRAVPRVVHAPTAPNAKGTPAVLEAVEALRGILDFEFVLLQNMPREQAIEEIRNADLLVDQLIVGDYGMAAIEAMAFGKPVICYVKPSLREVYPADLPIVDATPSTVGEALRDLIADPNRRHDLGVAGRDYVERHHDAMARARALVEVYQHVIEERRGPVGRRS